VPLGALARGESDHLGVHVAPYLAKRVAEVGLVFDSDKVFGRGRVDLDGLDVGGQTLNPDAVVGCRVGDVDGDDAALCVEVAEVVIEELTAEGFAFRSLKVVGSTGDGNNLAGREDVVVVVDLSQSRARDVEADLLAVPAGEIEVGVPGDGYRL